MRCSAGTVTIKVRYSDFTTVTRSQSLREATHATRALWDAVSAILDGDAPHRRAPVRLLGVGVSGLSHDAPRQQSLFDSDDRQRDRSLDEATDDIRDRFGRIAVQRGSSLRRSPRQK